MVKYKYKSKFTDFHRKIKIDSDTISMSQVSHIYPWANISSSTEGRASKVRKAVVSKQCQQKNKFCFCHANMHLLASLHPDNTPIHCPAMQRYTSKPFKSTYLFADTASVIAHSQERETNLLAAKKHEIEGDLVPHNRYE